MEYIDADGDGYLSDEDCDDANASVNPSTSELCDGLDNNYNGLSDDQDGGVSNGTTWYLDFDQDGFGGYHCQRLA